MSQIYTPNLITPYQNRTGNSLITYSNSQRLEDSLPDIFGQLAAEINNQPAMFQVTPDSLQASFKDGFGVIAWNNASQSIAGFVRCFPVLPESVQRSLTQPLYELGSLIVMPEHRGHRAGGALIQSLTEIMHDQNALLIATTKAPQAKREFTAAGWEAVDFDEVAYIMAATCSCPSPLGFGVQNSPAMSACNYRQLSNQSMQNIIPLIGTANQNSRICGLYTSDAGRLFHANQWLEVFHGTPANLITELANENHYGTFGVSA